MNGISAAVSAAKIRTTSDAGSSPSWPSRLQTTHLNSPGLMPATFARASTGPPIAATTSGSMSSRTPMNRHGNAPAPATAGPFPATGRVADIPNGKESNHAQHHPTPPPADPGHRRPAPPNPGDRPTARPVRARPPAADPPPEGGPHSLQETHVGALVADV